MPYIYSTLTASQNFVEWKETSDLPIAARKITILGGHGVINKQIVTPRGVVTKVSDKDMEFLKTYPPFLKMVEEGFLSYEDKKNVDVEKKIVHMNLKGDNSRQLTPAEFEKGTYDDPHNRLFTGLFKEGSRMAPQ